MGGSFDHSWIDDIQDILDSISGEGVRDMPTGAILKIFSRWGRELSKDRELMVREGSGYLAMWLRESNLKRFIERSCGDMSVLDGFRREDDELLVRAQPRGLVCHWIAGNVPSLALFSIIQSILAKNVNIIRIPRETIAGVLDHLRLLTGIVVEFDGINYRGTDLLKAVSVIYFPSSSHELNRELSRVADCKVIWGGADAVSSILKLPQREHCECIVFGPKYSFAVMEGDQMGDSELIKGLAIDMVLFDQNACSSPHVMFIEMEDGDIGACRSFAADLAAELTNLSKRYPKNYIPYSKIINTRGIYMLDPHKDVICSEELDWTILVDDSIGLEEPIASRTIFIKPVGSLDEIISLISPKIQTLGIAISDEERRVEFCERATAAGASRCVPLGKMNDYDSPWDGLLFIDRLVRWTSIRYPNGK